MQGKNRHILINAIKDMPEYEAPSGLWDNIEIMMLSVTVDRLPVHEISASAWTAVEAGIGRSSVFRKSFYRIISIAVLIFLLGSATIIYFHGSNFITSQQPEKSTSGKVITIPEDIREEENNINEEEKSLQDTKDPLIVKLPQGEESDNFSQKMQAENEVVTTNNIDKAVSQFSRDLDLIVLKPINIGFIAHQQKTAADSFNLNNSYRNDNAALNDDPFQECNFSSIDKSFYIGPGFE